MASLSNRLFANKRFDFNSKAFGESKFAVVTMEGFEAISQPFRFTLTLVSDDASIDFDTMLQNPATFRIYAPDGASSTPYHGILAEFDQLHRADGYVFYRAVLVPHLWRLSQYRISEVYLNEQSISTTLEAVLKNGRLTSADYELKLMGTYRPRSFVCQYQEPHLDFLSRWMEKEGMYYYFDHSGDSDKLIVLDNRTMHDAQATRINYRPGDQLDTGSSPDSVQDFVCRQRPLPNQVVLQDFNHRKASLTLKAEAIVSDSGIGEVMLYGENFRDLEEGKRYAKLRAEEIICGGKVFSGESTAVGLRSGYFAELSRHYREDFNGTYLITEIHHQGSQAGALLTGIQSQFNESGANAETSYHNSFRAIPATVQFRAERVTAKPRVSGTMSATIDSEGSGEYAELDAYGQYKVQLPFDRTEKNANKGSARVRMATPYSGSGHGMHFPLHKNAEVLLSFIDGDPDQPVILGAVPNSDNANIVDQKNPHQNRLSTAGGNQMVLGDTKGKEVVWLHSPFHNSTIGLGSTDSKGGGSIWTSTAGSSETLTVGVSNSVYAGIKNSVTASFENSVAASISNKMSLGASVGFALSSDIAWKAGRNVTLDDSEQISLKTEAKTLANNSVWIAGGQRAVVKETLEGVKTLVKGAVKTSLALNLVLALQSAKEITDATETKPKLDAWSPENSGVGTAQAILGGVLPSMLIHGLLWASANSIAEASKEATFASNIKVDGSGIDMSVDGIGEIPKSNVLIEKKKISLVSKDATPVGLSTLEVEPATIKLSANGVPLQTSKLRLTGHSARLYTKNPTGTVSLNHSNASLTLDETGASLISKTAKLELSPSSGAELGFNGNGVSVDSSEITIGFGIGVAKMILSSAAVEIKHATAVKLNGASVSVGGQLIKIG